MKEFYEKKNSYKFEIYTLTIFKYIINSSSKIEKYYIFILIFYYSEI